MKKPTVTRRKFIKTAGAVAGLGVASTGLILPNIAQATSRQQVISKVVEPKILSFRNAHTNEIFSGVYKVGDTYLDDALSQINYVLRDHRLNLMHPIDKDLIDLVHTVHSQSGQSREYEVLSGYRSPKTNNMLRKTGSGVARRSFHMEGKAIDLRIPGYSTQKLRRIAVAMRSGGVGYYNGSNFIHIDTGHVRSW